MAITLGNKLKAKIDTIIFDVNKLDTPLKENIIELLKEVKAKL